MLDKAKINLKTQEKLLQNKINEIRKEPKLASSLQDLDNISK